MANSTYMSNDRAYKLLGLFFLAFVLFNFPIISLFSVDQLVFGVPVLYLYVFVMWLVLILTLAFVINAPNKRKRK